MRTPILLLHDRYGTNGSTQQYITHFSEHFTDLGYRITLAHGHKDPGRLGSPAIAELVAPCLLETGAAPSPSAVKALAAEVALREPRLVFLHRLFHPAIHAALKKALPGTPFVWFAREEALPGGSSPSAPPDGEKHTRRTLEILKSLDLIVTTRASVEEALRPLLHQLYQLHQSHQSHQSQRLGSSAPSLRMLPPWRFHTTRARREAREGCILYAAPIAEERGLAELIQAVWRITADSGACLLALGAVTDRAYLAHCRRLAREAGAGSETGLARETSGSPRIEIHPNPSREELDKAHARAAVFALPNLHPDPMPPEVLQAMEWGLPIVAFDVGGVNALIREGETGLLARTGDVDDMAYKLERVLSNPDEARALGEAAEVFAGWEFHSREHVAALNRVFEDLLYHSGEHGPPDAAKAGKFPQIEIIG